VLILQEDKNGKPKIWIYYDKQTGQPKGDATITYEDEATATTSLDWFNGQQFMGAPLKVERADVYDWEAKRGGARGGRGGRGGRGRF
jgi:RNA recognition motif-containing protein